MMGKPILLDSGAFSAWKQEAELDVNEYIGFVKRHAHWLHAYFNLDVIPSYQWQREGFERAAASSYENHQRMKDAGLNPIPVYHEGEEFKWLQKYLDDGEPYIALAIHNKNAHARIRWLDDCFALISRKLPLIKTHGLGITTPLILHRYPWASVDSRTWSIGAGNGEVSIPLYKDGQPDYSLPHLKMAMTDRSRHCGRPHIDVADDFTIDRVHHYLKEIVGIDLAQARYSVTARWRAWLTYFRGLEQSANDHPTIHRHVTYKFRPAEWAFQIAFVTNVNAIQADLLAQNLRLLSFFDLRSKVAAFENYMAGTLSPPRKLKIKRDWHSDRYCAYRALSLFERIKMGRQMPDEG